jgi:hypothetical protein
MKKSKNKKLQLLETGIDSKTGKPIMMKHSVGEWITPTKYKDSHGKIHTTDPREISFQVRNNNNFNIYFENNHPDDLEKKAWNHIEIKPNEIKNVFHRYCIVYADFIGNMQNKKIDYTEISGNNKK